MVVVVVGALRGILLPVNKRIEYKCRTSNGWETNGLSFGNKLNMRLLWFVLIRNKKSDSESDPKTNFGYFDFVCFSIVKFLDLANLPIDEYHLTGIDFQENCHNFLPWSGRFIDFEQKMTKATKPIKSE